MSRRGIRTAVAAVLFGASVLFTLGFAARSSSESIDGTLVTAHSDDFAHGKAAFAYRLDTDQGSYDLDLADATPLLPRSSRVTVHGVKSGKTIAVAAGGLQAAAGSTVASTTGTRNVAVILFTFSDNASQPYTPSTVRGIAFSNANSVAAYYNEVSWGKLTMTGDVFGWYSIPATSSSCDYGTWGSQADAAATAAGVNLANYTNRVYAFPNVSSCGWAGLAYLPGSTSWLNGSGGMSLRVMSHELGHNFGTHHASSYNCTVSGVRVALAANAASCSADEYGDPFTVMGIASTRGHSNFSRGNFGWLTTANTQDVTATGTYSLHPIEPSDSAGVQALRIRRDSSSYLLLEYRTPSGTSFDNFSTSDPAVLGVSIRIVPAYSSLIQSKLIDTTPSTGTFGDAPLAVGRTFTDPLTGVTIATSSVSTGGASVQVTFGGGGGGVTPDTTAPSVPAGLKATKTGNKNKPRINLTWSASTDNVGVTGYRVYRNGGLLATVTTTSYTDTAPPKGTDSYTVVAFDAAGNASAASAPAVVSV